MPVATLMLLFMAAFGPFILLAAIVAMSPRK